MELSKKNEKVNPMQDIHMSVHSNEDARIPVDVAHAIEIESNMRTPRHTIINVESIGERVDKMESIVE